MSDSASPCPKLPAQRKFQRRRIQRGVGVLGFRCADRIAAFVKTQGQAEHTD